MGKKKSTGKNEKKVDLYELMKIQRDATEKDIRKAYYLLARKVHPDKNPNDPQAEENFKALQQAYEILKDPVKRKHYDRTGSVGDDMTDGFWQAYQKYKTVEVTKEDIEEHLRKFRNSPEEERDLKDFFNKAEGNVTNILGYIVGSEDADIQRFVEFFEQGLQNGELDAKFKEAFETSKDSIASLAELDEEELGSEDDDDEEEEEEEDEDDNDFIANEEDEDGEENVEDKEEESEDEESEDEEAEKPKFHVGDVVDARWRKGPKYYQGVVKNVHSKAGKVTYDVEFTDDQYFEKGIQESHVRPSKKKTATAKNTKRKANTPPVQKESQPKKGRGAKSAKSAEDDDYDGDMDALRAAILKKNAQRSSAFSDFEKRWEGK